MTLQPDLAATAKALIHKPASDVFDAFVNPATMSRFWFTRRDDGLREGDPTPVAAASAPGQAGADRQAP